MSSISKHEKEVCAMSKWNRLVAVALLGLTLAACQKEGPAEKTGKEIDKAVKDLGQSMEKAADSVKEATKSK
jgi:outer membrane PBP1 activator LpoA protein